jgi:lipopolysaccharide exporter
MLSAAFFSLVQRFSVPLFGVLNFMLIVRMFNTEQVGTWALYTTIITLIEVAKSGFIRNASIRQLSLHEETESVSSASLIVNTLFTLVIIFTIGLSCIGLSFYVDDQLLIRLLGIFCVQLLVFIVFSHIDYHASSATNFKVMMVAYLIRNASMFLVLASIFLLNFTITLEGLAIIQIVCLSLATVFLLFKYKTQFTWRYEKEKVKDIIAFGKYVFATNTSSMLFRSTDHYLLASLLSNTSVAYYNVAMRITNLIDLPSTAASEVLFPISVKGLKDKGLDEVKRLFEKTVGYTMVLVIPMTVFSFVLAKPIILIIAGEPYLAAIPVLQITLLYGLLLPYLKQLGTTLNILNKPQIGFYLMLFTFLLNIVTNYFCITWLGMLGAAYGTLFSYTVSIFITYQILKKELNVSFINTFRYYISAHKDLLIKLKGLPK